MKDYLILPKEKKQGNGGGMAHFVIATAFNKGIVMCKQHHEKFTVKQFAELVKENVLKTLNPSGGLFL